METRTQENVFDSFSVVEVTSPTNVCNGCDQMDVSDWGFGFTLPQSNV